MHSFLFANLGLESHLAENGKIAIDLHRSGASFDLILMDVEMPIMNGVQVVIHVFKIHICICICFFFFLIMEDLTVHIIESDVKLLVNYTHNHLYFSNLNSNIRKKVTPNFIHIFKKTKWQIKRKDVHVTYP